MNYPPYTIPIVFALIGLEALTGWLMGRGYYRFNDTAANLSNGSMKRLSKITFDGMFMILYAVLYQRFAVIRIPASSVTAWVAVFLLLDLVYYWHHRFSHRVNFAWAAHIVHHQSEEMNLTVALRMSATQTIIHWCFNMPVALLGFSPAMFLTCYVISTVAMDWYHTRLIRRMGPLEWIFMTPSNHRVHHGCDPEYLNKNYGGILVVWDLLFGTYRRETREPTYGVVKQLQSFNPLWAQFHYWIYLAQLSRRLPGIWDKIGVWFRTPEWAATAAGYSSDDVARRPKYDPRLDPQRMAYAVAQFAAAFGMAIAFGDIYRGTELLPKFVFGIFVAFSLISVSSVFDGRRWTLLSEPLRLVLTPLAAYGASRAIHVSDSALVAISMITAVSLAWFALIGWRSAEPLGSIAREEPAALADLALIRVPPARRRPF